MTHINDVHGDDVQPFECAECNKTFKKPIELKYHEQTHNGNTLKGSFTLNVNVCVCDFEDNRSNGNKTQGKEWVLYPFSASMSTSP